MPEIFDFDYGNTVYDVVTRQDYERWEEKAHIARLEERRKIALENGEPDPFLETPF